jgi:hypothetical protein
MADDSEDALRQRQKRDKQAYVAGYHQWRTALEQSASLREAAADNKKEPINGR